MSSIFVMSELELELGCGQFGFGSEEHVDKQPKDVRRAVITHHEVSSFRRSKHNIRKWSRLLRLLSEQRKGRTLVQRRGGGVYRLYEVNLLSRSPQSFAQLPTWRRHAHRRGFANRGGASADSSSRKSPIPRNPSSGDTSPSAPSSV